MTESSESRVAHKLSDVKESLCWFSLQIPELEKLEPRVGHALVSVEPGKVLMIGGANEDGALSQVLSISLEPVNDGDGDSDTKNRVTEHPATNSFSPKYEFSCTKDRSGHVWIFGGADQNKNTNEVVQIKSDGEVKVFPSDDSSPSPRTQGSSSSLVEWKGKEYLAVFSGGLQGEKPVDDRDLHLFSIEDKAWQRVKVKLKEGEAAHLFASQPPSLQGHVMASVGSKIFVHGGMNGTTLYDGFHWLDLAKENDDSTYSWFENSNVSLCDEIPPARAAHGIAKVSDVEESSPLLYIFGGLKVAGVNNDLWSFNANSMSWTQVTKNRGAESYGHYPPPRLDFAMCAVGHRDETGVLSTYLLIHGGMSPPSTFYNDAWIMRL